MHTAFKTILAFAMWASCALASAAHVNNISVQEALAMTKKGAMLLDVREPHEYAEIHAPGSLLIPLAQFMARLQEFRAFENKPILLICRSGQRSGAAADRLIREGFKSVYNIQGGINAWEKSGLPVERR